MPTTSHRDNLFGICHAIGAAFGFNPIYLRIAFMLAMLIDFPIAAAAYLLAGGVVLIAIAIDRLVTRRAPLVEAR